MIFLMLLGCSIDISQPTKAAPLPAPTSGVETKIAATSTPIANKIPITWGGQDLTGRLVYITAVFHNNGLLITVQQLDLATGVVLTIFQAPDGGWIDGLAVSPDYKQLVISYLPPTNPPSYGGQQALYKLPLDGSEPPQLLFSLPSDTDLYFQPEWSPDAKYVYFVHVNNELPRTYEVARVAYPDGAVEDLADDAYWPRVSNDGSYLTYVSPAIGINRLFVANADGTDAVQVPLTGPSIPNVIDAPMFLADDQSILFSAPVLGQTSAPSWADMLFGITVASADGSIPSDWWSVPIAGGSPKRLTHLQSLALFASFSPDKKHIASYSADGVFIMNPDGSGVTQIVNYTGGITGAISWIP
jgi:Tol biopolymer transport system component